MDDDINELDMSWVNELNETINQYKDFYKEQCLKINVYYLYISKTNELIRIKKESLELQNGICKGEIISSKSELKNYTIESFSKFNIDIEPQEIVNGVFFKETQETGDLSSDLSSYFKSYNRLQDIHFNDTVKFLQKVNTLFVLLKESIKEKNKENINGKKSGKKTKRVSFMLHHNKTRKR